MLGLRFWIGTLQPLVLIIIHDLESHLSHVTGPSLSPPPSLKHFWFLLSEQSGGEWQVSCEGGVQTKQSLGGAAEPSRHPIFSSELRSGPAAPSFAVVLSIPGPGLLLSGCWESQGMEQ